MIIGIPKEIKALENRVAMTPGGVELLVQQGHQVLCQYGAGIGCGFTDADFQAAGAQLVSAEHAWQAELVIKVKEPLASEFQYLRPGLILFTFLHLAANVALTQALLAQGTTAIAYETIQNAAHQLPLLMPMSEIAGRMAIQIGAHFLEKPHGGAGVLLSGLPGVLPGSVVILGGGIVGTNAAQIAVGLGAHVTVIDVAHERLQHLEERFPGRVSTLMSTAPNIREAVKTADLLVGAVLIPGAQAPQLVNRALLKTMKPGSVIVDVAVDQGGCIETTRVTTHDNPTYVVEAVIHYGVANMPGSVPRTATFALTHQTLAYIIRLADQGLAALQADEYFALGLNTFEGKVTCAAVEEALTARL
ncbi:MAG: alanine dehydrogenase [Pseudomonadota bacterium]|nr:alanine dehydrogenase [Pseudomonadota bacterium]